jgi:hypothetical protein
MIPSKQLYKARDGKELSLIKMIKLLITSILSSTYLRALIKMIKLLVTSILIEIFA